MAKGRAEAEREASGRARAGRRKGGERVLAALVCALIAWFYVWTVRSNGEAWNFGQEQRDYYNLLIDGWLEGQLHMKVEVPEALLKLENPYDPAQRPPGLGLHDASYYKGKYYVYFGAVPVVALMLPFRVVTGVDLPLPAAILGFAFGGFIVSAMLLLAVRRRYFPAANVALSLACLAVLATVSMVPLLLRRPSIWELPLSGGYFFAMGALAGVYRCLHTERRGIAWLALASASLGLAVASRPTYLFSGLLLLVPALWWSRWKTRLAGEGGAVGAAWWPWVAAILPMGLIGAALALYNFARFENPFEFGMRYAFTGIYEANARHFSADYLGYNLRLYFFQPAEWSWYFPFLHATRPPTFPPGYFGFEFVFGLLASAPVLWFALAAIRGARGRTEDERGRLVAFTAAAAVLALGTTTTLGFFYAAMGRYQVDFAPTWALLGCVGVLVIERWTRSTKAAVRVGVRAGLWAALAMSVGFGMLASLELYGNFRQLNPAGFRKLAAVANHPAFWWERISGAAWGPLELALRLPAAARPGREVLVATGAYGVADAIFLEYQENGDVRFGHLHAGGSSMLSRPLALDRARTQRVRVEMGSLLPPEGHRLLKKATEPEQRRLMRRLRVEIDGDVVLESEQRFHPAVSWRPKLANAAAAELAEMRPFSGDVVQVARDEKWWERGVEQTERLTMRVEFPIEPGPRWEPLFCTGTGDVRGVGLARVTEPGVVELAWGTAAGGVHRFAPLPIDGRRTYLVEWVASMRPVARGGAEAAGETRLLAKIDGVPVGTWRGEQAVQLSTWVLGNGGVTQTQHVEIASVFRGIVHSSDYQAGERVAEFGAVRLRVVFPTERRGMREPLVVTGEAGRGDLLLVEYLDAQRVRFGLDHWGKPTLWSEPVVVARDAPHIVEIALGSFPRAGRTSAVLQPLTVRMDGREVWATETRLYPVEAKDVTVARNPIGGTACEPLFTGSVLSVEFVEGGDSVRR